MSPSYRSLQRAELLFSIRYYVLVTSFTLGQAPHRMTVVLSPGTDFVATIVRSDNVAWPVGAAVQLVIDALTGWDAVVAGAAVNFDISDVTVAAAIATSPKKAKLYYTNGSTRLLWASGPVVVQ